MSKEAKLKYKSGSFEIVEHGDHVICAISGKKILLENLKYWNVKLQEAYNGPDEIAKKFLNE